ncbi:MAG: 30S ribosome-binding factor RbfA [Phycisphaerales bacterium]
MSGHRTDKIASTMQREIQAVLTRGLADPRVQGLITVTEVQVSADLRHAKTLVSILPEEKEQLAIAGLQAATRRVQKQVNDRLHMRRPPQIEFELDRRFKQQAEVLAAIRRATDERENATADESLTDLRSEFEPDRDDETGRASANDQD